MQTDPVLLRRVLNNLANNAIEAMPDGGKLEIGAFRRNSAIILCVSDTGAGIPEEVKPKLFTPLVTTKSKGQGFGLSVVKRMTEALGGFVTFESKIGKGTTFMITLTQT
jgi:signal transduction histidine kinase